MNQIDTTYNFNTSVSLQPVLKGDYNHISMYRTTGDTIDIIPFMTANNYRVGEALERRKNGATEEEIDAIYE